MNAFLYSHLGDAALRRGMLAAVPRFHLASATAIAHIAEFDARRLYVPEGYPSMSAFCVHELGLTGEVAKKLIRAGRTALKFPAIFPALADGRLNATAVLLLAPWLTSENAQELLAAAGRRSNEEIRRLLADRAPKLDVPLTLEPVSGIAGPRGGEGSVQTPVHTGPGAEVSARTPVACDRAPKLSPLGTGRFEARCTRGQATHEAMQAFEQLMGRKVSSEHMNEALRRGFEAMTSAIEKQRFAATDRPRKQRKASKGRHIPAAVKRAVRQRDGDRCTFVAASGHRCEARGKLEFDHIVPVARGGQSTAGNLRLRCRAHNQYEAEQVFGAGFMQTKRERAASALDGRKGSVERRARAGAAAPPAAASHSDRTAEPASRPAEAPPLDPALDVTPWLLRLGIRRKDAARAAAHCEAMPDAPLEVRVKEALSFLAPPARVVSFGGSAARMS